MLEDEREIKQTSINSTTPLIYCLEFLSIIEFSFKVNLIIKNDIPLEFVTHHMQWMKNAACYKTLLWLTKFTKNLVEVGNSSWKIFTSFGQYFAYLLLIYFRLRKTFTSSGQYFAYLLLIYFRLRKIFFSSGQYFAYLLLIYFRSHHESNTNETYTFQ